MASAIVIPKLAKDQPLKPLEAAIAGGKYLTSHINADGSYVYQLDALTGAQSDDYNILRHAGTTYSLLELFEVTRDEELLRETERALEFLQTLAIPCPDIAEAQCISEGSEIKLGGNGLAVLAFSKHAAVTGKSDFLPTAQLLAAWMLATQSSEGEFQKHKIDSQGVVSDFISEYYPGEALFAFARLALVTGDRVWVEAAHRGAQWIINVRDGGKPFNDLPHDHWFLYALNELHADKQEPAYLEHARKITDAIVADQHWGLRGDQEDWNGGFSDPPRSTPTATRSEGLSAAVELFERAGDTAYKAKALTAFQRGIEFQLRTQMTAAKAKRLGADPTTVGGFYEALEDYDIRIDYVQHNISALLAAERLVPTVRE